MIHKTDEPDSVTYSNSHMLAGESAAEIYFPSADADSAAAGHENRLVVKRIIDLGQSAVGSRRGGVDFKQSASDGGGNRPA